MLDLRRVRPALWIAAALCVALPASASGTVTIGSNLAAAPTDAIDCGAFGCTASHKALPAPTSAAPGGVLAPSDGVVVRWRIRVGVLPIPVALRITRPGDSGARSGAGTGPTVTPTANQTSTFDDVRLPIQSGDTVGIDCFCQNVVLYALANTPNASFIRWIPALLDGEPPRSDATTFNGQELLVNADIEPDADRDGFGDETQDQCPTDTSTQGTCPDTDPPETTITKGAPNKLDEHKVKFKFTSTEPDSTFECKLDKKKFKACTSPRKVKHLDGGKHKFKVVATDAAGNTDPTAAKDKFKVLG